MLFLVVLRQLVRVCCCVTSLDACSLLMFKNHYYDGEGGGMRPFATPRIGLMTRKEASWSKLPIPATDLGSKNYM